VQVRIKIECAFGMLTERWAILRSAMPKNLRIHKIICLVQALAKLHNFCIDRQELSAGELHPCDFASLIRNSDGYVSLARTEHSHELVPVQLLNGCDHFDDVERGSRNRQYAENLPRQRLCEMVQRQHLVRPRPRSSLSG
jgi:hypothetical protein